VRLVVARVGRAHGIRGEATIELRTDEPQQRFRPGVILYLMTPVAGLGESLTLRSVRDHNGTVLLSFDGIDDRSGIEALRGVLLEADVPDETGEPDSWYDHQLVGLTVLTVDGRHLGEVVAVHHPPAQDLLVVRRSDGEQRLVPFVAVLVPTVDLAAGHLVVADVGGLVED
jgi:16S rRNA processing protein RimM